MSWEGQSLATYEGMQLNIQRRFDGLLSTIRNAHEQGRACELMFNSNLSVALSVITPQTNNHLPMLITREALI